MSDEVEDPVVDIPAYAAETPAYAAEEQALFDVDPDWKDSWQGMPEYSHDDLMPWQSIYVHFQTQKDREDFAKLVGQHLHAKTKFIWYPKAVIRKAVDKVWTSGGKVTPRHPVYIISKGRWESRLTSKALEWIKVPYHIVVEPQEYTNYAAVIDPAKILTLPFSNLGLGGIPARNWVWDHARQTGAVRHWILDDNISGFCRFQDNLKVEVDSGATFAAIEDFTERYENVMISGFNYDYFAPRKQGSRIKPFTLNTRIYSGILLSNDLKEADGSPMRWRGRYNEDTDLSLRILKAGHATVLFNAFLMYKKPTLTMKGGNTDELYKGAEAMTAEWELHCTSCGVCSACKDGYSSALTPCEAGRQILSKDGRWLMAESLREQHPDVTTVERKWQRWQHQVDYTRFRLQRDGGQGKNELILKPDAVISDEVDNYGMDLAPMPGELGHDARNAAMGVQPEAGQQEAPGSSEDGGLPGSELSSSREGSLTTEPEQQPGQLEQPSPVSALDFVRAVDLSPELAVAEQLLARGFRFLTRDGKLFVTPASALTEEDRELIKRNKPALLAIAEPWPSNEPAVHPSTSLFETATPSTASLADFLGGAPPRVEANYVADEIPDLSGVDEIVLNFATDGLNWAKGARPVGVTVATLDGQLTRFLPFAFAGGGNLPEAAVLDFLRGIKNKKIYNANTRFDLHMGRTIDVDFEAQGCTFTDVQHTAALLDDHRKRFNIDLLAEDFLPDLPKVGRVDETQHHQYHASAAAAREKYTAELVWRLRDAMYPELDKQELRQVQELEDAVIPCVVEMEKNGAPIDRALLEQYHADCLKKHGELMWSISRECGFAFEHTAKGWQRLFEKLGLPPTDGNSEAVIDEIDHPLVKRAYLATQYASLDSKTFKAYLDKVGDDDVLRFDINQLRGDDGGTVSGRFSIGLVQQVPNADNHQAVFGDELFPRRVFVAREGEYLEADAMQIEQRLNVHYSDSKKLIAEYEGDLERLLRGEEPVSYHKVTWKLIKEYKADMLYSHQKSFNFAFQYGAKSIKLAVMMKFIKDAEGAEIRRMKRWDDPRLKTIKEIEAAYKKMNPEGYALLERAAHLAKSQCDEFCRKGDALHKKYPHRGFVKTLLGRRSRFPNNFKTYIGLNRVLQGTGADIMKKKLVELHAARQHTGFTMRMTIHDAVGGDARTPETRQMVSDILNTQSYTLKVPILWEVKTGPTWADCK